MSHARTAATSAASVSELASSAPHTAGDCLCACYTGCTSKQRFPTSWFRRDRAAPRDRYSNRSDQNPDRSTGKCSCPARKHCGGEDFLSFFFGGRQKKTPTPA